MFTDILWRFLMLETFVMGALCCSCDDKHPQKQFCESDFVFKVDIKKEAKSGKSRVTFKVKIKEIFKGDVEELDFIQNGYASLEMSRLCVDAYVKPGNTYVFFGTNKEDPQYKLNCYGSKPWNETTRFYKRALVIEYKANCDCYPHTMDLSPDIRKCRKKFSFLKRRGKNCKWVNRSAFRRCTTVRP